VGAVYRVGFVKFYGGGGWTTHPPIYFIDSIDLSSFYKPALIKKAAEIYGEGHSLAEVSHRLDVPKSSVRKTLRDAGVNLRPHPKGRRGKCVGSTPYGYVRLLEELFEDQKEQRIIQVILHHWKSGKKFSHIAEILDRQKLRPRVAEKWDGGTIRKIIIRSKI
jgi:hypothetical protein